MTLRRPNHKAHHARLRLLAAALVLCALGHGCNDRADEDDSVAADIQQGEKGEDTSGDAADSSGAPSSHAFKCCKSEGTED